MSCTCKNCGNVFDGNFCNNCGQAAATHQINTAFLAHDLQHGLLHVDGGIFYSARELFRRPGHAIRDYIDGKRIKHYRPVSMVLVLASLYAMFYHMLSINVLEGVHNAPVDYDHIDEWIIHHFSIITLLIIPILSAASWLSFRKQGYNFTEHLILNSFYSSQKYGCASSPCRYFISSTATRQGCKSCSG